jgi:hypothetical protein
MLVQESLTQVTTLIHLFSPDSLRRRRKRIEGKGEEDGRIEGEGETICSKLLKKERKRAQEMERKKIPSD